MKNKTYTLILVVVMMQLLPNQVWAESAVPNYINWFKSANAQIRIAASYLRTGNTDFAALALEEIAEVKVPATSKNLASMIKQTRKQSVVAINLIDANEPQKARSMLLTLRQELFRANKTAGLQVFDDCIWQLNKKGPPLWHFRRDRPDLNNKQQSKAVEIAAESYLKQLNKCDEFAGPKLSGNADYKRLVHGARESLERIPTEAIKEKDGGLLFRFIIELRSFDRLLYFRYG